MTFYLWKIQTFMDPQQRKGEQWLTCSLKAWKERMGTTCPSRFASEAQCGKTRLAYPSMVRRRARYSRMRSPSCSAFTWCSLNASNTMSHIVPMCVRALLAYNVPVAYAQQVLKGLRSVHALVPDAYAQCTHQFLTRMLSARISSWRLCSAYASVPDAHAQCTQQLLKRAEGIQNEHLKNRKLMRMPGRNRYVWSGCASVPDAHTQREHKGRNSCLRNSIFSIIFAIPLKKNRNCY